MREALRLVRKKLINVIAGLAGFADEYKALPTLGFTSRNDRTEEPDERMEFFVKHMQETAFRLYGHPSVIAYTIFKKDGRYYYPLGLNLAIGMTLFIIVSYVWPNAIAIRPTVMPRDNIFTRLVAFLYMTDTPTNVLPSIHVYDSIGMHWGMCQTEFFRTHKRARRNSFILMILILLATLFIKQHSIIDLMAGIALQLVVGIITYGPANGWIFRTARKFDSDVSLSSTPEAKNLSSEA